MVKLLTVRRAGKSRATAYYSSGRLFPTTYTPPTCTTLDSDARMHWQHRTTYLRVASAHVASSD